MRTTVHRFALFLIALAWAVALSGCAGARVPPALVSGQPTPADVQEVRRLAGKVADGATLALEVAHNTGVLLDALPIAPAQKDGYDCAVLRVTGLDTPSATVSTVCGPLPTAAAAPLTVARVKLQALTTCPSLRATTALVLGAVQPFIEQLRTQASLAFLAQALTTSIDFARAVLEGGETCQ